jgi:hypothetical protein
MTRALNVLNPSWLISGSIPLSRFLNERRFYAEFDLSCLDGVLTAYTFEP